MDQRDHRATVVGANTEQLGKGQFPRVLVSTENWLVIDKPAGWHSVAAKISDGGPDVQTWLAELEPQLAALQESGLVQRLDKQTSGCLMVARTANERDRLRDAVSGRLPGVTKHYAALVGRGIEPEGEFALFFSSRYPRSQRMTVRQQGDERECGVCRWRVADMTSRGWGAGPHCQFNLLDVELIGPGRRHQIRAGLTHLGYPIAGDIQYGGAEVAALAGRVGLHAWRVTIDGTEVEAPLPAAITDCRGAPAQSPGSQTGP